MNATVTLAMLTTLVLLIAPLPAGAQAGPPREALARELQRAWLPLESGLAVSAGEGTPISGKYEIDDGTFQLSVYTLGAGAAGDAFFEVIVDHDTGGIRRVERITDGGDLAAARGQRDAMAKAARSLAAVTAQAVTANPGYRAVSALPALDGDRPVVEVTLVGAGGWKILSERLD